MTAAGASQDYAKLVVKLLDLEPSTRWSVAQALQEPWLQRLASSLASPSPLDPSSGFPSTSDLPSPSSNSARAARMPMPLFSSPSALPLLMPSSISSISSDVGLAGSTVSKDITPSNRQGHSCACASASAALASTHTVNGVLVSHAAAASPDPSGAHSHDQEPSGIQSKVWSRTGKGPQLGSEVVALESPLNGSRRDSLSGGMVDLANSIAVADFQQGGQSGSTDALANSRAYSDRQIDTLGHLLDETVENSAVRHVQSCSQIAKADDAANTCMDLELLAAADCCAKAVQGIGAVYVLLDAEPLCHLEFSSVFRSAVFALFACSVGHAAFLHCLLAVCVDAACLRSLLAIGNVCCISASLVRSIALFACARWDRADCFAIDAHLECVQQM